MPAYSRYQVDQPTVLPYELQAYSEQSFKQWLIFGSKGQDGLSLTVTEVSDHLRPPGPSRVTRSTTNVYTDSNTDAYDEDQADNETDAETDAETEADSDSHIVFGTESDTDIESDLVPIPPVPLVDFTLTIDIKQDHKGYKPRQHIEFRSDKVESQAQALFTKLRKHPPPPQL